MLASSGSTLSVQIQCKAKILALLLLTLTRGKQSRSSLCPDIIYLLAPRKRYYYFWTLIIETLTPIVGLCKSLDWEQVGRFHKFKWSVLQESSAAPLVRLLVL